MSSRLFLLCLALAYCQHSMLVEGDSILIHSNDENPAISSQTEELSYSQFNELNNNAVKRNIKIDPKKIAEQTTDVKLGLDPNKFRSTGSKYEDPLSIPGLLKDMVANTIAPVQEYAGLVDRYQKWYRQYNAAQRRSKVSIPNALNVLREEYAKIDDRLMACTRNKALKVLPSPIDQDELSNEPVIDEAANEKLTQAYKSILSESESVDFVFKILKELIDVLEDKLVDVESGDQQLGEVQLTAEEIAANDERIRIAMERVRRISMVTAMDIASSEFVQFAKSAAITGITHYLADQHLNNGALGFLAPLVTMMGSASTPVLVRYLTNAQFRAALAIINKVAPVDFSERCSRIVSNLKTQKTF